MRNLLAMEFGKLLRLSSVRFSLVLLLLFPFLWSYAPGIFEIYGFYLVSGFQVPALSLLSSMEFLLPLLVAIAAAELLGLEIANGTLPTVLLRPVTRSQWILAKVVAAAAYPFFVVLYLFVTSLLAGIPHGFGAFVGGTGLGAGGIIGQGQMSAGAALAEIASSFLVAGFSLVPIALLAIVFSVVFMNAAGGALATLSTLIFMQLLVVFPALEPYLLTAQLRSYIEPVAGMGWVVALIALYSAAFAATSVIVFERKDF